MATLPPPDLEKRKQALSLVTTSLPLLHGFTHRNKNQHRTQKWWSQFDMFRRNTRKLAVDLDASVAALSRPPPPQKRKKKKKSAPSTAPTPPDLPLLRARWLRDALLPRVYLAFTQLSADNQYAPLGLFLLGVLGDVYTAVTLLLGDDVAPETVTVEEGKGEAAQGADRLAGGGGGGVGNGKTEDLGQVVAREDLKEMMMRRAQADREREGAAAALGTEGRIVEGERPVKAKRSSPPQDGPRVLEKRPKKRRKRKGTEIDEIFSSLI